MAGRGIRAERKQQRRDDEIRLARREDEQAASQALQDSRNKTQLTATDLQGRYGIAGKNIDNSGALTRTNVNAQNNMDVQGLRNTGALNLANTRNKGAMDLAGFDAKTKKSMQGLRLNAAVDDREADRNFQREMGRSNFAQNYTLAGGEDGNQIDPFGGVDYSGLRIPQPAPKSNTKVYSGSLNSKGPQPGLVNMDTGVLQPFKSPEDDEENRYKAMKAKNDANEYRYGN